MSTTALNRTQLVNGSAMISSENNVTQEKGLGLVIKEASTSY